MFKDRVKFSVFWLLSLIVALLAGASIIVGTIKFALAGSSISNPVFRMGYLVGSEIGVWNLYPDSGPASDFLLSAGGILSFAIFIISVICGWLSMRFLVEVNVTARSLRAEKLINKYR
ncbi:hypothetical protein [Acetobacter indonesiensis]|uniref:hypothetical protein n=1 Tax=Acetobacter TaxID=434 RepID=UPI001F179B70|nr:hypothetical protein [Acetobacter indonesiensis]MCG0996448.1 hypothetical protein [Acetobacter indonesiensis]